VTTVLDISIGPVQSFVAQSRRTRDLWGSSYLLALLATHAMHAASRGNNKVVQPCVEDDPLFQWVSGMPTHQAPLIGSLPNHFKVRVGGDAQAVAAASIEAFRSAWNRVCEAVWRRFVAPAEALGNDTCRIWDRQVQAFWEVTWTAGHSDQRLLTWRKHWRSHRLPDEPGDKCTVMHDLQELSGHLRATGKEARKAQDAFWQCVRSNMGLLDLREDERLCAVALVKRMFSKVAKEVLGWPLDTTHWPSTVYVGAVPWIRRVLQHAPEEAAVYAAAVQEHAKGALAEKSPKFQGLGATVAGNFARLDANYFHTDYLASERLCPLDPAAGGERRKLVHLLETVYEKKIGRHEEIGPPPIFYGLLLADGDRLGDLERKLGSDRVSRALAAFTSGVQGTVKKHDGVTIYAGGDDVLAVIPVAKSLACADAIAENYAGAFRETGPRPDAEPTLSAALVLAHVRLPLSTVLGQARRLLDKVAKDGNGRGSLAVGIYKRGGLHSQWVSAWMRSYDGRPARAVERALNLANQLRKAGSDPGLSSSLIHRIRETLALLCGQNRWTPWRMG
jgi:CRISPR-associated protein Cmr2